MSRIGLVLGGGGITGAAYEFAVLMALQMATGWDPADADVMIGTSAGATVAAATRGGALTIESLAGPHASRRAHAEYMSGMLARRTRPVGFARWVRRGILPGIRRPGLDLALGGPAPFDPDGIGDYVQSLIGDQAHGWPDKPTLIVAFDLVNRKRTVFGAAGSPDVPIRDAVAASSAVPMVYQPVALNGHLYVDGGAYSGTSADLLLTHSDPLDLVIVVAAMAAETPRPNARFYENIFDRAGHKALKGELEEITETWPNTEVMVLRPDETILSASRPNPMSVEATLPTFLRTLTFLRRELAKTEVWSVLERHLVSNNRQKARPA